MNDYTWQYPVRLAAFDKPGEFTAWTAGSANREYSAAAWDVRRNGATEPPVSREVASKGKSSAPRAQLAAAVGAIETIPHGCTLLIYTGDEYVANAINKDTEAWFENEWTNSAGVAVKNADILIRIRSLILDRQLSVTALFVRRDDKINRNRINRLRARAAAMLRT